MQRNKYVDLKINGRLFPTWVVKNFEDYQLDEIALGDTDPCTIQETNKQLKKYQIFLSQFMNFNSPYKSILIYHGLGSGKTRSAINIYNVLYNYTPGWNVFILLPASLHPSWVDELDKYLDKEDKSSRFKNISFIHFNAPNADKSFFDEVKKADTSKKNLFIIDECHKFISNVYSNISSQGGKRAQSIYDYIIQDQRENLDTRVITLSATPSANNPFELALLFNLLRHDCFPKSEIEFNKLFISSVNMKSINPIHKNLFQRRIAGLVSYYVGSTPEYFASQRVEYVNVRMDKYQEEIYNFFDAEENKLAKRLQRKNKGVDAQKLKTYTRQACNFVFPYLKQGYTGESRPRPKNFKISNKDSQTLLEGRVEDIKEAEVVNNVKQYKNALDDYVKLFENKLDDLNKKDIENKHTIQQDIQTYKDKYDGKFEEYNEKELNKSSLYKELYTCSAKMLCILFTMMKSKGPILVYSNYVLIEGLQIFKLYMKYFNYVPYSSYVGDKSKDKLRFAEYHGGIDKVERADIIKIFQSEENKLGDVCRVILISPAGAEGLNLYSVRQVHIMEPYWQEVRILQTIGRALRLCGHKFLPKEERHVDVYRYKSIRHVDNPLLAPTADQYIEEVSRGKQGLIQSFLDAIQEAAIDCMLFKNHNMMGKDYKCFQFNEPSLFDEQIGPAYKEDIDDDKKFDNGLNSTNSKAIQIKVYKIKAVKQLDAEGTKFGDEEDFLYNPDTNIIYNINLHYPVGKIAKDIEGIARKLKDNVFIYDKVIPVPEIKLPKTK